MVNLRRPPPRTATPTPATPAPALASAASPNNGNMDASLEEQTNQQAQDDKSKINPDVDKNPESDEEPLSPIVGYDDIDSSDNEDEDMMSDSSETEILSESTPANITPTSQRRKRQQRKRHKRFMKREEASESIVIKRLKMNDESSSIVSLIDDDNAELQSDLPVAVAVAESSSSSPMRMPVDVGECEVPAATPQFQFASGKPVIVSDAALKKAQAIFATIDETVMPKKIISGNARLKMDDNNGGAQSASGLPVAESSSSSSSSLSQMPAGGATFQLASGKPVIVSEAALKKARAIFATIDEEIGNVPKKTIGSISGTDTGSKKLGAPSRLSTSTSKQKPFKAPTPIRRPTSTSTSSSTSSLAGSNLATTSSSGRIETITSATATATVTSTVDPAMTEDMQDILNAFLAAEEESDEPDGF